LNTKYLGNKNKQHDLRSADWSSGDETAATKGFVGKA
jgi:hypothetical protein